MATQFGEMKSELQDILDDTSATVDAYINNAIQYCTTFFQNKIDQTIAITEEGESITAPERMMSVKKITINDEDIKELDDWAKAETAKSVGAKRYYYTPTRINFSFTIKTTDTMRIIYEQKWTTLDEDTDETDVPTEYQPLIIQCALWMYLRKINQMVNANREKYPDVDPDEIRRARDAAKQEFDDMLKSLQLEI